MSGVITWDALVALTIARLSKEIGEPVVHGVDVLLEPEDAGRRVRYTSLTDKGYRALRIAQGKMVR